jgi:chemotaxis signal transduction protein
MNLDDRDSYLEIQIDGKISALLPMISIQEVINIPAANVVPVPNLAAQALGLLNHRSQIYLVMDLGQILSLSALDMSLAKYAVVILKVEESILAIAIPAIKGVHKLTDTQIQPIPTDLSKQLTPFLEGYLSDLALPVLSPIALAKASIL